MMRPRPTLLTFLCSLLCLIFLIPTAHAESPAKRGDKQKPDPIGCPCPCDQQQVAQWLGGQLDQLGNALGPVGLERANEIAKKLRDIADDLRKGKIGPGDALGALDEQEQKLQKLIDDLELDMEAVKNDTSLTPKRKESRLRELQKQKDLIHRIQNGVTIARARKCRPD